MKGAENKIYAKKNYGRRLIEIFLARPVYSAAASILILVIASWFIFNAGKPKPKYSEVKVKQAEVQVKETLAIIDRVFQSTRRTIEEDVLKKQVSPPIREGIYVVNNLFKGG